MKRRASNMTRERMGLKRRSSLTKTTGISGEGSCVSPQGSGKKRRDSLLKRERRLSNGTTLKVAQQTTTTTTRLRTDSTRMKSVVSSPIIHDIMILLFLQKIFCHSANIFIFIFIFMFKYRLLYRLLLGK